ncbi:glycosyltransferase family 2 protein [Streptomyces cavernae]|uniref:glycosyltransferase family 2 protein n=1 Tax=Streptomyces cavernae TaxID=2259034 RepID=UPI000FEB61DD|nr:glycosyltransferase family 2 protein [Streptomyces cavernae]
MSFSITALVPAHNEEQGLGDTLESLLAQTEPFDEIIVVDDCSTDRTWEVALAYGVTVITPDSNQGSKAKAQNYGLASVRTDLVLPVDADTLLAPDYVELIKVPFRDGRVAVAAGCVQTRFENTATERGRSIEYLFGFHFQRPIQNAANSPVVCSGCCSAFRTDELRRFGGFPERTIVEDMDYTWSKQIEGRKAVYVGDAMAWAADPSDLKYLRKQVWRWMAGFFQNVRIHSRHMVRNKPLLLLWVLIAVWDILTAPLWYAMPFVLIFGMHQSVTVTLLWWAVAELVLLTPPLLYAARRRKLPYLRVMRNLPYVYLNKMVNVWYAWRALIVELVAVPLKLTQGLCVYEKGRA